MSNTTRRFTVGIALLLIGLSLVLAVILTASRTVRANPGVLYAAPTAQGSGDCSNWANACTMQTALAQAISGDEIWVKMGVYYPTTTPNNRQATFTLKNGVALYGGFSGTESSRDERDWQNNITVLSGDIDHNDITDPNGVVTTTAYITGTNSYHVVTANAINTAELDGFIITAGLANGSIMADQIGGGMLNNSSSLSLRNVTFSGNKASSWGGGMCNMNSSNPMLINVTFSGNRAAYGGGMYNVANSNPTLTEVTFSDNTALEGGGMYNLSSSPTLNEVIFSDNAAELGCGGGMYNDNHSSPVLTNVAFVDNQAMPFYGGGMYNRNYSSPRLINVTFTGNMALDGGGLDNDDYSSPTLINVTFSNNKAGGRGGGMYNYNNSNPTLLNVTFSGNTVTEAFGDGGGIGNENSSPVLVNVIMWGDSAPTRPEIYNWNGSIPIISYSDIQSCGSSSGWDGTCGTDGGGNIDADPLFVDAANGNLRLLPGSPCIDAGDNTAIPAGIITDMDGNPRFVDIPTVPDTGNGMPPIVDMGAYEAQGKRIFLPLVLRSAP